MYKPLNCLFCYTLFYHLSILSLRGTAFCQGHWKHPSLSSVMYSISKSEGFLLLGGFGLGVVVVVLFWFFLFGFGVFLVFCLFVLVLIWFLRVFWLDFPLRKFLRNINKNILNNTKIIFSEVLSVSSEWQICYSLYYTPLPFTSCYCTFCWWFKTPLFIDQAFN